MTALLIRRTIAGQKPSGATLCCAAFLERQDGGSRVRRSKRRARNSASRGITAKVFATLNELAIEAVRTCSERITVEAIEAWKPAIEKEAAFA